MPAPGDTTTVPTRPLGKTGVSVPVMGFGTVKFGRTGGMKYPDAYRLPDDQSVQALLDIAQEAGVTLLDTAPAYQRSEQRLGEFIKARGDRERWFISTKAGESFDGERSSYDFTGQGITSSLDESLRKLKTDAVELVLIHSDGASETRFEELGAFDALHRAKQAGKARFIGVSPKTEAGARHAMDAGVDVLMLACSPADDSMSGVIDESHAKGIGVLIKKAFASGHLGMIDGKDPIESAMRFSLSKPGVSSIVSGTINPAHLRQNIAAAIRASSEISP